MSTASHDCMAHLTLSHLYQLPLDLLVWYVCLLFSLQKLDFLQCGEFTQTSPPYFIDLSRILGSSDVTNDDIFDWIEVCHVSCVYIIGCVTSTTVPKKCSTTLHTLFLHLTSNVCSSRKTVWRRQHWVHLLDLWGHLQLPWSRLLWQVPTCFSCNNIGMAFLFAHAGHW